MAPTIHLLGFEIHCWGYLMALGFALAAAQVATRFAAAGYHPGWVLELSLVAFIAGAVGAAGWGFIITGEPVMVSFGGLIFGVLCVLMAVRIRGLPVWPLADMMAPGVALGVAFGRLGCLLNGCCYGGPCAPELPWALRLPGLMPIAGSDNLLVPLPHRQVLGGLDTALPATHELLAGPLPSYHPTQLYASLMAFAGYLLLTRWLPRKRFHGEVTLALIALYGGWRFVSELWRVDTALSPLGISMGQQMGLAMVLVSVPLLVYNRRRCLSTPPPPPAPHSSGPAA